MGFTDEDLKRLGEAIKEYGRIIGGVDLYGLLHRLEAAEHEREMFKEALKDIASGEHDCFESDCDSTCGMFWQEKTAQEALALWDRTWRKAKGDVSESEQSAGKD